MTDYAKPSKPVASNRASRRAGAARTPATYCKRTYKRRNVIERMFGTLKDWRRIATRYDRCAETFFAAIVIAATITFWINES